jgi:hypothetical protein
LVLGLPPGLPLRHMLTAEQINAIHRLHWGDTGRCARSPAISTSAAPP